MNRSFLFISFCAQVKRGQREMFKKQLWQHWILIQFDPLSYRNVCMVDSGSDKKKKKKNQPELQGPSELMYHHLQGLALELLEYFTSLHDLLFLGRSWILFITRSFCAPRLYNITQFIFWKRAPGREISAAKQRPPSITQSQYLKASKELFNARRR